MIDKAIVWKISKSISIEGCKNPLVAILASKPLKLHYIQVCKPKIFPLPATVRLHICNLLFIGCIIINFFLLSPIVSPLTFLILSLIFFPFLVSPPTLFSVLVLHLSLYFSLLRFAFFSLYSQHVSRSSISSHLTKFWLDQISGCWVLVMAFRWWVSILELNQWPTLVVGCFDVCWIRLVWDGNFCPTHG